MKKILIVDDERMILNSLVLGYDWKGSGCEVVGTASGGREALSLVESLRPDVVFTDIRMPGMSGLELITACRRVSPGTVFVVISGYADFSYAQEAIRLGAAAYCLKPLEKEDIALALSKADDLLDKAGKLYKAHMERFLTEPTPDNADALLAPLGETGETCVAMALGKPLNAFAGAFPGVHYALSDGCHMHLMRASDAFLEEPSFRAALFGAASSGALEAFVYDVTASPRQYLCQRLAPLMDELYAAYFSRARAAFGRVRPGEHQPPALMAELAALCNKNRAYEALARLRAITPGERGEMRMTDALRLYNLCDALLCRMRNEPIPRKLRYGYELAALYPGFDALLPAMVGKLERALGAAIPPEELHNEALAAVVGEVNRRFAEPVDFQALCARHFINPSYLSQLFKKETGTTFTQYVNRLRLGYACELLEATSAPISEISDRAGYESPAHFTKVFKKEHGITPKQYRRQSAHGRGE